MATTSLWHVISNRPRLIETNRKSKSLVRTPDDVDFEMKDGNHQHCY